ESDRADTAVAGFAQHLPTQVTAEARGLGGGALAIGEPENSILDQAPHRLAGVAADVVGGLAEGQGGVPCGAIGQHDLRAQRSANLRGSRDQSKPRARLDLQLAEQPWPIHASALLRSADRPAMAV